MDTPSSLFLDMPGIDGAFSGDKGAPTLDQSFPMFAESVVKRGVPFTSSKMKMVRGLGGWGDATEEATEAADTDVLQTKATFVRPTGLFTETDSNASMTLPTRSSRTPSVAPELIPRTTRLSTSRKTTSSLSSDTSGSSGSLTSAATDITEPDHEPPKKRTRATRKVKKEAAEDDMRNKFLERNRVAASKCREKKKEFVSKLEETKITLERKHTQLQVEYNALITEVGGLKHDLMTHAKCNDANIDKWIANEARKFVQTSDIFGHRAAAAVAAQHDNPFVHAHTRHSSATSSVQPHGLGSFSSASARRDSMAYSQGTSLDYGIPADNLIDPAWAASSVHTSPTALAFPTLASPKFDRDMTSMNFDHMPDDMFDAEP
jgi:cyclic AMP-dependent transcription factor ATF-2